MTQSNLPSFFIAGVPKAGTTSVFDWLNAHPQTQGSSVKETCFFADRNSHVFRPEFNSDMGLDTYRTAFPRGVQGNTLLFEATPSYIYSARALEMIPDLPTKPKCLFILREPASQIHSIYQFFRNTWSYIPAEMSFADYLAAIRVGSHTFGGNELARDALINADYAPWLRQWLARLGPDRMKVCLFEDLKTDPQTLMVDLAKWIGLDPAFYSAFSFAGSNQSYQVRNRTVHRLNMAMRDYLPKGRAYNVLRDLYRRLNTQPVAKDAASQDILMLKQEFAEAYLALEREFQLDLSPWRN